MVPITAAQTTTTSDACHAVGRRPKEGARLAIDRPAAAAMIQRRGRQYPLGTPRSKSGGTGNPLTVLPLMRIRQAGSASKLHKLALRSNGCHRNPFRRLTFCGVVAMRLGVTLSPETATESARGGLLYA